MTEERAKYLVDGSQSQAYTDARKLLGTDKTESQKKRDREEYMHLLTLHKGKAFDDLPCDDRGCLVLAWLSVCGHAEQLLHRAHTETDLMLLDIEQILDTPTMDPAEILEHRREGLLGYFAQTIQEHLDDQHLAQF